MLFNNAGVSKRNPIAEAPDEDWDWVTSVDLMGPMYGVYAFVPRMREQEGPRTSSTPPPSPASSPART